MNATDCVWIAKWSVDRFPPIVPEQNLMYYGTPTEPESSLWCASLSEPIGKRFKEGLRVLDYGCGCGRYANFLSRKLRTFTYYGPDVRNEVGSIDQCLQTFGNDKRVRFDYVDTELAAEAIASAQVAILGSVFTHLLWNRFEEICIKLMPVVQRGGIIVFSAYIANNYTIQEKDPLRKAPGRTPYGLDCYYRVFYTMDLIRSYATKHQIDIQIVNSHPRDSGKQHEKTHRHEILLAKKMITI